MADRRPARRLDVPRDGRRRMLPQWDPEVFGRASERIARFMGTARFLAYMTVFIVVWIAWNTLGPAPFDPYTFTFLTLLLSLQASYAAPLILLAQNRQADRDRVSLEEDRQRAAAAKADTEFLTREIAALRIALGEVATRDFLRSELNRLVDEERREERREEKRAGAAGEELRADRRADRRGEPRPDRKDPARRRRDEQPVDGRHPVPTPAGRTE